MPSERFHNLKPIKKRNFLKMAYREFALHSYEGASITRLVFDLKMAKGSVYQYFIDKHDLYQYLIEHAENQFEELIAKTCPVPKENSSFNDWLTKVTLIQVKFLLAFPSYARLFIRQRADFNEPELVWFMHKNLKEAELNCKMNMIDEHKYQLVQIPFLLFNFIINSEEIDLNQIINSDSSIEVATDKLLYLCEAFLQKPNY